VSRPGLDPSEAANLSRRTVMGASIAEPRSAKGIGKSRRGLTPDAAIFEVIGKPWRTIAGVACSSPLADVQS